MNFSGLTLHKVKAAIKKETPKAYLVVCKNPQDSKEYREYWIPKSQVISLKKSTENDNCSIFKVSDWIFLRLKPASGKIYQDYGTEKKKEVVPEPGKRQYVLKKREFKQYDPLEPLTKDDIPF